MKRRIKKILVILVICFSFYANNMAAVVSDNDGSAFITKSEFDSLKNDFQVKLNQYNANIDSKIDNAIASYLAGIEVSKDPANYFTRVKSALGEVRFLNAIKTTNATITTNEVLNIYRHWFQKRYTGMKYITKFFPGTYPDSNGLYWTYAVALLKSGTESSYSDLNSNTYLLQTTNGKWSGSVSPSGSWLTGPNGTMDNGSQSGLSTKDMYGTKNKSVETAGSGVVYRYKVTPSGRAVITQYASTFYPTCSINIYGHSYKNYAANFWTNYKGTNLQKDDTSLTCSVGSVTSYGSVGTGTPYAPTYAGTTAETRWNAVVYNVMTTDNVQYERMIWGLVPSGNIYCVNETANLVAGTSKTSEASVTQSTISAENYESAQGKKYVDVTLSGIKVTYTPPKINTETARIGGFCNDYVSTIIGETVYHGQGIKIGKMPQEGKCKVTLKFKNAGNENASLEYILTDGKVGVPGTRVFYNEVYSCNSSVTITKEIDFDKESELWINCFSTTTGVDLILDDVELKLINS